MYAEPKISVIIPVYNVEQYLKICINSIINQTFKDFEIICINDGSTDDSFSILEDYKKNDSRIIVINQENQGPGVARNIGIEKSRGEYIVFVDPDDYVNPDMLEIIYNKFKSTDADIIQFNFETCDENGNNTRKHNISKSIKKKTRFILKHNTLFKFSDLKVKTFNAFMHCVWDKAYSAKFIKDNNIKLSSYKFGEDNIFSITSYLLASKILYLDEYFYHYRTRSNSIIHSASDENFCVFDIINDLKTFLVNNDFYEIYKNAYIEYILQALACHYTNIPAESLDRYLKMCSALLTNDEYNKFMQNTKLKYSLLEKIFSIKNKKVCGKKQKILRILGCKIYI